MDSLCIICIIFMLYLDIYYYNNLIAIVETNDDNQSVFVSNEHNLPIWNFYLYLYSLFAIILLPILLSLVMIDGQSFIWALGSLTYLTIILVLF